MPAGTSLDLTIDSKFLLQYEVGLPQHLPKTYFWNFHTERYFSSALEDFT